MSSKVIVNGKHLKDKGVLNRKTTSEKIVYTIVFIIFAIFALSYLYLLFWCFYSGLRTNDDIAAHPFGFSAPHFRNYIDVFTEMESNGVGYGEMFLNSIYFCLFGSFLSVFTTCAFAYVCCKYKFPFSKYIYFIIILVNTMPIYGSGSAQYKLMYNLGFINSRLMLLTSINGHNMNFLYFFGFFAGISNSYKEAAELDGCNPWQIYFRVIFPQALTMFGSLFIIVWMGDWNNYGTALIYLNKMPTLAVGMYQFRMDMTYGARMDILYAACGMSCLPALIIFIVCNNALMSNISLGGIKE